MRHHIGFWIKQDGACKCVQHCACQAVGHFYFKCNCHVEDYVHISCSADSSLPRRKVP